MFLSLYDVNSCARHLSMNVCTVRLDDQSRDPRAWWFSRVLCKMVGRGGLEPPTSRLSGVRSNHLSYRPILGGAYRDRTDDLLNANQALSQLS